MEEESLLNQVLRRGIASRNDNNNNNNNNNNSNSNSNSNSNNNNINGQTNTLLVDVFLLPYKNKYEQQHHHRHHQGFPPEHWLELAKIANELNQYIQSTHYPWIQGGDGPVFGLHLSSSSLSSDNSHTSNNDIFMMIPHLRASCRYNASVADEWTLIGIVLEYSSCFSIEKKSNFEMVVECTDVDDGQVLLIQAADYLPPWVDRLGPWYCQHCCWIVQGEVHLIEPPDNQDKKQHTPSSLLLSLGQALELLQNNNHNNASDSRPRRAVKPYPEITRCINDTVTKIRQTPQDHRTALVVPRPLALVLEARPDFIPFLVQAFCDHVKDPIPPSRRDDEQLESLCHDQEWVWITTALGRTTYAMLRSVVGPPDWKTESSIPKRFQSPQVKRLQRSSQQAMTPHLQHAVPSGVRLLAGLDSILRKDQKQENLKRQPTSKTDKAPPFTETTGLPTLPETRVTHYWDFLLCRQATNGENGSPSWLWKAWQAGPNHSSHNLEHVLKCPVFAMEVQDAVSPLSCPGVPLAAQLRQALSSATLKVECMGDTTGRDWTVPPSPKDVDREEDWMTIDEEAMEQMLERTQPRIPNKKDNDHAYNVSDRAEHRVSKLLDGFHTFMHDTSDYEGVASPSTNKAGDISSFRISRESDIVTINPRVFLNLLQNTLKSKSGEEVREMLMMANDGEGGDEFFSSQDYDMEGESDGDEDSDNELGDDDEVIRGMMHAMDQELREKQSGSRPRGGTDGQVLANDDDNFDDDDDDIENNIHLVSNLLKSLDAGGGGAGPVNSILLGMGNDAFRIIPDSVEDDSDDNDDEV